MRSGAGRKPRPPCSRLRPGGSACLGVPNSNHPSVGAATAAHRAVRRPRLRAQQAARCVVVFKLASPALGVCDEPRTGTARRSARCALVLVRSARCARCTVVSHCCLCCLCRLVEWRSVKCGCETCRGDVVYARGTALLKPCRCCACCVAREVGRQKIARQIRRGARAAAAVPAPLARRAGPSLDTLPVPLPSPSDLSASPPKQRHNFVHPAVPRNAAVPLASGAASLPEECLTVARQRAGRYGATADARGA